MRAALIPVSLLGWLLLVPPKEARYPNPPMPVSRWERVARFASAEKCDEHLEEKLDDHDHRFNGAACISTDDPRLRAK
jgi:hypothetical protein